MLLQLDEENKETYLVFSSYSLKMGLTQCKLYASIEWGEQGHLFSFL